MIHDIWPHQYDVAYQKPTIRETDFMLIYQENKLLCRIVNGQAQYPMVKEVLNIYPKSVIEKTSYFLFRMDNKNYFGLRKEGISEFGDWKYLSKEKIRKIRPIWKAFAGITGFQIHSWYLQNQFCGICGEKMKPSGKERALCCSACKSAIYPKICPSIIAGVIKEGKILMTKYAAGHSSYKKYALIAGYVEIGESLEDTVRREVMEEVGISVKNIRYYKSQPWAFSDALLVGFFCEAESGAEIIMDQEELSEAEWFDRKNIPIERSEAEISLTGEMIEAFQNGLI